MDTNSPSSPFMPSGFNKGNKPDLRSGFTSKFGSQPGSAGTNSGGAKPKESFMSLLFGSGRKPIKKEEAANAPEAGKAKKYFTQNSEKLSKFAPDLAQSWKKAMPDSFATRDKAKQTMGKAFGAKGDGWVPADKIRQMEKAVKEGRYGDKSLSGFDPNALKGIKYDSKKREAFVKGIRSLNEKKF